MIPVAASTTARPAPATTPALTPPSTSPPVGATGSVITVCVPVPARYVHPRPGAAAAGIAVRAAAVLRLDLSFYGEVFLTELLYVNFYIVLSAEVYESALYSGSVLSRPALAYLYLFIFGKLSRGLAKKFLCLRSNISIANVVEHADHVIIIVRRKIICVGL